MNKTILFLAVICIISIGQVQSACSNFDEGEYDCTFTPSSSYSSDNDVEEFTLDITSTPSNNVQDFTITSSNVCPNNDDGTIQITGNSTAVLQISESCDYILFGSNNETDDLVSASFSSSCDSFSGTIRSSSTSNNKGKLVCSLNNNNNNSNGSNNNNNSSSANVLVPSIVAAAVLLFAML